jgi:hypothetical protein
VVVSRRLQRARSVDVGGGFQRTCANLGIAAKGRIGKRILWALDVLTVEHAHLCFVIAGADDARVGGGLIDAGEVVRRQLYGQRPERFGQLGACAGA